MVAEARARRGGGSTPAHWTKPQRANSASWAAVSSTVMVEGSLADEAG